MFDEHSSPNTKPSESMAPITKTRKAALRNSSGSLAPSVLFSAEAHLPESPREREGRFAHPEPGHLPQVLLPVFELGERTLLYVGLKEPPCLLIELGSLALSLPRPKGASFAYSLHVALDRGEAHRESPGSLAFAHAPLGHSFDYLLSEIFRISIHSLMMTHGPGSLQAALDIVSSTSQL
jgi:hypothetical protein